MYHCTPSCRCRIHQNNTDLEKIFIKGFASWEIKHALLSSADFFQNIFFENLILQEHHTT